MSANGSVGPSKLYDNASMFTTVASICIRAKLPEQIALDQGDIVVFIILQRLYLNLLLCDVLLSPILDFSAWVKIIYSQ